MSPKAKRAQGRPKSDAPKAIQVSAYLTEEEVAGLDAWVPGGVGADMRGLEITRSAKLRWLILGAIGSA